MTTAAEAMAKAEEKTEETKDQLPEDVDKKKAAADVFAVLSLLAIHHGVTAIMENMTKVPPGKCEPPIERLENIVAVLQHIINSYRELEKEKTDEKQDKQTEGREG